MANTPPESSWAHHYPDGKSPFEGITPPTPPPTSQPTLTPESPSTDVRVGDILKDTSVKSIRKEFEDAGFATSDLAKTEQEIANIKAEEAERLRKIREGISTRFDELIGEQREIGAAEIGGTKARLATLRGAGASSSRINFIADQQRQNDKLIKQFKTAREEAKLNADTAAADRETARIEKLKDYNFKLRQQSFDEAQAFLNESRLREQANLAKSKEARTAEEYEYEKLEREKEDAIEQITNSAGAGVDINDIDQATRTQLEEAAGLLPGTFDEFYRKVQSAQQAKAIDDDIKFQQSLIDLLNDVPVNVQIPIGGKLYRGLKKEPEPNVYTYESIDSATNTKTKIAINKLTGDELWRKDMGMAYKYTGGGKTTTPTKLTTKETGLLAGYPKEFVTWWKGQSPEFRAKATRESVASEYERFRENLPAKLRSDDDTIITNEDLAI